MNHPLSFTGDPAVDVPRLVERYGLAAVMSAVAAEHDRQTLRKLAGEEPATSLEAVRSVEGQLSLFCSCSVPSPVTTDGVAPMCADCRCEITS